MSYYRLIDDEAAPAMRATLTELRRLADATVHWRQIE